MKQSKHQIDLNVEDTSDLQNLLGLERFNQLKTALAPLIVSTLNPHYHEQFLHESQRTGKYVPGLDRPMFEITTKKIVIDLRELAISGGDFPTDVHECAVTWRRRIEAKVEVEYQMLREKARPAGGPTIRD